jgi:hypothetical protein
MTSKNRGQETFGRPMDITDLARHVIEGSRYLDVTKCAWNLNGMCFPPRDRGEELRQHMLVRVLDETFPFLRNMRIMERVPCRSDRWQRIDNLRVLTPESKIVPFVPCIKLYQNFSTQVPFGFTESLVPKPGHTAKNALVRSFNHYSWTFSIR